MVQEIERIVFRTANGARARANVDTGLLRASIRTSVSVVGSVVKGRIYTPVDYAYFVHQGTGLYGSGAMIVPKNAKALRWTSRGAVVFSKKSSGYRGNPFLVRALRDASPWPVVVYDQ